MKDIIVSKTGLKWKVVVLDECASPSLIGSYNNGVQDCPCCGGNDTCYLDAKFQSPIVAGWYCKECNLLWVFKEIN